MVPMGKIQVHQQCPVGLTVAGGAGVTTYGARSPSGLYSSPHVILRCFMFPSDPLHLPHDLEGGLGDPHRERDCLQDFMDIVLRLPRSLEAPPASGYRWCRLHSTRHVFHVSLSLLTHIFQSLCRTYAVSGTSKGRAQPCCPISAEQSCTFQHMA